MRYNLESTLPINAFSPRGKGPFVRGMTLEGGGGGGGVLSPVTKAFGSVAKGVTDVVKGVVQPVYNATLKNIPGVDKALVSLDKSVGKAIPGGWGTVAAIASSFIPGAALATMGLTQTGLATGLGALSGSGVMHKDNKFNLQGAIMGGAMAYGAAQLGEAFQNAGKELASAPSGASSNAVSNVVQPGSGYVPEGGMTGNFAPPSAPTPPPSLAKDVFAGYSPTGSEAATQAYTPPPSMLDKVSTSIGNIPSNIQSGITSLGDSASKVFDPATYNGLGTKIADTASGTVSNMGDAISGAGKVLTGSASLPAGTVMGAGVPMVLGASGLAALEEQKKYLDEQAASGALSNSEYNSQVSQINAQIDTAKQAVAAHPLQSGTDLSTISEGPSLYAKQTNSDTLYDKNPSGGSELLYAAGGAVNPMSTNPPDDQTNIANQSPIQQIGGQSSMRTLPSLGPDFNWGNMQAYQGTRADETASMQANQAAGIQTMGSVGQPLFNPAGNVAQTSMPQSTGTGPQSYYGGSQLSNGIGGLGGMGSNQSAFPLQGNYGIVKMAAGGMAPRFLSGGGDGMSDSIEANINGQQEARLADGEFVVPADVVSHLGNGSSKAGAKQLYSMMDKVRQARTGTKKQGKQINPRKFLAA